MSVEVNNVYELTVIGKQDGQAVINVLHYRVFPGGVSTDADTPVYLAELLAARWVAQMIPLQSNTYQLTGVLGREIELATVMPPDQEHEKKWVKLQIGETGLFVENLPEPGDVLTPALPTFVSAGFRKQTGYGGKHWRGSMRLGGLVEDQTDGSNYAPGVHAALTTRGNAFFQHLQSANGPFNKYEMVVFSPAYLLTIPNVNQTTPALLTRTVQAFVPNPFPTSQVSRKKAAQA